MQSNIAVVTIKAHHLLNPQYLTQFILIL